MGRVKVVRIVGEVVISGGGEEQLPITSDSTPELDGVPVLDNGGIQTPRAQISIQRPIPQPVQNEYSYFEIGYEKYRVEKSSGTVEQYKLVAVDNVEDYAMYKTTKTGPKMVPVEKGILLKREWVKKSN